MREMRISKGIGKAIGLFREAQAANSRTVTVEKPGQEGSQDQAIFSVGAYENTKPTGEDCPRYSDDEYWDLDDFQTSEALKSQETGIMSQDLIDEITKGPHPEPQSTNKLPLPVIIPQRRPQNKSRGFVKAYAPVLEGCGITQAMFFEFLENFEKSIKASPYFNAVNIGVFALHAVPSPAAQALVFAAHVAVESARRVEITRESNYYLNKMNEVLFKPHGLCCLLMTYKPSSESEVENINMSQIAATSLERAKNGVQGQFHNAFHDSEGTSHGEFQLPESAPLVFPGIDKMGTSEDSFMGKNKRLLGDYFDRRAQATFAAENPDSVLSKGHNIEFVSRYSDPTSAANSGGFVALATGGNVTKKNEDGARRRMGPIRAFLQSQTRSSGSTNDKSASSTNGSGNETAKTKKKTKREEKSVRGLGLVRAAKKTIKQNVLYLVIVNLPTEEDMRAAAALVVRK